MNKHEMHRRIVFLQMFQFAPRNSYPLRVKCVTLQTSRKILDLAGATATYRLSCSTGRCDPCRGTARRPVSSRPLYTRPTKCPRSPCIPSRGSPAGPHTQPVRITTCNTYKCVHPLRNVPREREVSTLFSNFYILYRKESLQRASLGLLRNVVVGLKAQFRREEGSRSRRRRRWSAKRVDRGI